MFIRKLDFIQLQQKIKNLQNRCDKLERTLDSIVKARIEDHELKFMKDGELVEVPFTMPYMKYSIERETHNRIGIFVKTYDDETYYILFNKDNLTYMKVRTNGIDF